MFLYHQLSRWKRNFKKKNNNNNKDKTTPEDSRISAGFIKNVSSLFDDSNRLKIHNKQQMNIS